MRVRTYSEIIPREMDLVPSIQKALRVAGLIHDIGKIGIPKAVLQKRGDLTDAEMAEVQKHPLPSYDIVSDVPGLLAIANIVFHHHERLDGCGYPHGIAGDKIPLGSRILCVADSFDADGPRDQPRGETSRLMNAGGILLLSSAGSADA